MSKAKADSDKLDATRFAKRRVPRQDRSRFMVDNIKRATLELIEKEGFARLGTARIAERAGVSIGSLYHYFPTCEAILFALYEDATVGLVSTAKLMLLKIMDMPQAAGIDHVVRSMLKLHVQNQLLLIQLDKEKPELRLKEHPLSLDQLTRGSIRIYLHHQRPELEPARVERMAQFINHTVLSSIHWYLAESPSGYSKENFISDLSRMIGAYIDNQI